MPSNTIKVGMVGSSIQTRNFVPGHTLMQAIKSAGFNPEGFDVLCGGSKVTDLSRPASAGDLIILSKKVKGASLDLSPYATITLVTADGQTQDQLVDSAERPTVTTILDQAGIDFEGVRVFVGDDAHDLLGFNDPVYDGMRLSVFTLEQLIAPSAEPEPFVPSPIPPDVVSPLLADLAAPQFSFEVKGTEPGALYDEAEQLLGEVDQLEVQIHIAQASAREKLAKAAAYKAKAIEIANALQAFETAKQALITLGVSIPKDEEPEAPKPFFRSLLDNASFAALKVVAKALGVKMSTSKATIIARLMGEK